mgnify:CR=1 FL=1
MATSVEDNIFYYYHSSLQGKDTPKKFSVLADDDIATLSEMMSDVNLSLHNVK